MEERVGDRAVYYIPDNFIEEGRVFRGRFRIRYLAEALVLGLISASAALILIRCFPAMALEARIFLIIFTGGPAFAAGLSGYNGDPLSAVIRSAVLWSRHRSAMLYNRNPRLLKRDPLLTVLSEERSLDGLIQGLEDRRREELVRKTEARLREGTDFRFAEDRFVDEYTGRRRKRPGSRGKGKPGGEKEFRIRPARTPAENLTGELDLTETPEAAGFGWNPGEFRPGSLFQGREEV